MVNISCRPLRQDDNNSPVYSGVIEINLNTDYCVTLERFNGSSTVKLSAFEGYECTIPANGSPQCLNVSGMVENLEYLVHGNLFYTTTGTVTLTVDDLYLNDVIQYNPNVTVYPSGPYLYCETEAPFYFGTDHYGEWLPPLSPDGYFDPKLHVGTNTFTFREGKSGSWCAKTASITVTVLPPPTFTFTTDPNPKYSDDNIFFYWPTDLHPFYADDNNIIAFEWSFGHGATETSAPSCNSTINNVKSPVIHYDPGCYNPPNTHLLDPPASGYPICLEIWFDGPGDCKSYKYCKNMFKRETQPLKRDGSIEGAEESVVIYPNPASDVMQVKGLPENAGVIRIINFSGIVVFEKHSFSGGSMEIDISQYSSGMYTLIIGEGADVEPIKFMIE